MYMALQCHTNGRSRKNSNCFIATKIAILIATLIAHDEITEEEHSHVKL